MQSQTVPSSSPFILLFEHTESCSPDLSVPSMNGPDDLLKAVNEVLILVGVSWDARWHMNSHQETSWSLRLHSRAAPESSCRGLPGLELWEPSIISTLTPFMFCIWHVVLLHRAKLLSTLGPVAGSTWSLPRRKSVLQDRRLDLMTLLYVASSWLHESLSPPPRKWSPSPVPTFSHCSFV